MEVDDIAKLAVIFSLVVIPALGITARLALKPIVDAIVRLREGGVIPSVGAGTQNEVAQLRGEIRGIREDMLQIHDAIANLSETAEFHRALGEPPQAQLPGRSEEPAP